MCDQCVARFTSSQCPDRSQNRSHVQGRGQASRFRQVGDLRIRLHSDGTRQSLPRSADPEGSGLGVALAENLAGGFGAVRNAGGGNRMRAGCAGSGVEAAGVDSANRC
jgi:hypothetical protein